MNAGKVGRQIAGKEKRGFHLCENMNFYNLVRCKRYNLMMRPKKNSRDSYNGAKKIWVGR